MIHFQTVSGAMTQIHVLTARLDFMKTQQHSSVLNARGIVWHANRARIVPSVKWGIGRHRGIA